MWRQVINLITKLNECHTRFERLSRNDLFDDIRSKVNRIYQNFWNSNIINEIVRHLQHNSIDATTWTIIKLMNEKIKQLNIE